MKLGELVTGVTDGADLAPEAGSREVLDVVNDSRKVRPGSLFVAVRGFHSDGHRFIPQAAGQGAVAIIAEENSALEGAGVVPVIRVRDTRRALAALATKFYGYPSRRLRLVGITGTNGKTTTSYIAKSIIEASGKKAGLIGTIDYRIGDRIYPAPNTTPESLDLQKLMAEMAGVGVEYCVMEVSSHALALGRTDGCEFETAAFTNLTQDHLDFHETMDAYFEAKLSLFAGLSPDKTAVVNIDDTRAGDIVRRTTARVITTGLSERADVRPMGTISHGIDGLSFSMKTPSGEVSVSSSLVGGHNVHNILTAAGLGFALGISPGAIAEGIRNMKAVPGRMEKIEEGQSFGVIVDYAHTEDALVRLLEAIGDVAENRVVTVFGCGGDRDRTKRPRMGAAAMKGSDLVIVTSDNPRTEDPMAIISEIEAGMTSPGAGLPGGAKPYLVIPDRAEAIEAAINLAQPGDVVVLAGKGHEDYQIIGEKKSSFDDREKARKAIRKRNAKG